MTHSTLYRIIAVLALLLVGINPGRATIAAPDVPTQAQSVEGPRQPPVVLRADPNVSIQRVPAPASMRSAQHMQSASIIINYIPKGGADVFGAPCLAWPTAAQTAFTYAASIWETLIHSSVPIVLQACWTDMGTSYLGYSAIDNYEHDFTGAPLPHTWYPASLANALTDSDLEPSRPDIHLSYNKAMHDAKQWYFGIDGNTPSNQYDFVSVVLHEIAHGLGFAGTMSVSGGSGSWGEETPYPDIYDRFTKDGSGNALLNTTLYPNPSAALGTALTNNNVWFDGPHANAANGGRRVKLYAPSSWEPGSSYSHLDYATFKNTENSLMVYALSFGASNHSPGPVTMGLLRDIGWSLFIANTPPVLASLPDQPLAPGESKSNAINLWAHASDAEDIDTDLTFTITNSPPLTVGVTIRDNQYIDINPTDSFTGIFPVVVEVTDTGGLTDTGTFTITVAESGTWYLYLPLVLDCCPVLPALQYQQPGW